MQIFRIFHPMGFTVIHPPGVLILSFYQLFSFLAIADRFIRLNEQGAPLPYQELEPERGRRSRTRSEVRAKRPNHPTTSVN
jgi:hypothetical protein